VSLRIFCYFTLKPALTLAFVPFNSVGLNYLREDLTLILRY